jgi:hypothetical protein
MTTITDVLADITNNPPCILLTSIVLWFVLFFTTGCYEEYRLKNILDAVCEYECEDECGDECDHINAYNTRSTTLRSYVSKTRSGRKYK